ANEALQEMGLIERFEEDKTNRATTRFLADYSYNSLYKDFKEKKEISEKMKASNAKKKAVKKLNLDAFESDIPDSFKETIEASKTTK
ncbi:RepB family plasmid replication initiator protein, partial [Pseudomonas fragi]